MYTQSHATSQSLRACSKCTTLPCSEPCHLTVSYEPVRLVYDYAVFRAMPPHSLFEPVRSVRLRCVQSHATSQSLTSLFGWCTTLPCSEPCHLTVSYEPVRSVRLCCVQSHATSQSLRACSVRRIRRIAQYKKCLVHASMTSHFLYCAAWL